jgi:hypothetical protein
LITAGCVVLPKALNAVAAGGRNEEINSKYAKGIRKINIRARSSTREVGTLTKAEYD